MNNKSNAKLYVMLGAILMLIIAFVACKNVTKI